ncbi:ABC transporter ATP-binding protein [Tistrella mobilis]|uniref:ABC transporter ATP-binding protein n=1 Tax=Tistrella mobilis TaxID=171437 RepID=UPI003557D7A1
MSRLLTVSDLAAGYGEVDIVSGISLHVDALEIVTIAGTNGSGKSTLVKALMGLLTRVRGEMRLGDVPLLGVPAEKRIDLGVVYVPQVENVFPTLTVTENLQVVEGVADRRRRIGEMFDRFPALAERRRTRAGALSGGERQQLAFARALMPAPKLMILDEPTAALSPALVHEVLELIRGLPGLGVSALLVEQRARQALAISDRGYILDTGRVVIHDTAERLLADERMADLYLGTH